MTIPSADDILAAEARIADYIHHTPVMTSRRIDDICGASLYFKCENLQKVGAFKYRGATNAVRLLSDEEAEKGVATHSSGNHAQALALAANLRGIPAYIVMPDNAPEVKKNAVAGYGAEIIFCKPTLKAREETLASVVERTGAHFVHPYDNFNIVAGQASACHELIEDCPDLDIVMPPVGGGGLLAGTALSAKYFGRDIAVYGAEPSGADDARRSLHSGEILPSVDPDTVADGLLTSLGKLNFDIIWEQVEDILTVPDQLIIRAMKLIWESMKIIVEPSAAVPLAAVMDNADIFRGKRTGLILSGGNVDLSKLLW